MRARARGGNTNVHRQRKRVAWDLPPATAARILEGQGFVCALTGKPFEESEGYGSSNPFRPSPNRINPGGDYVESNCEFVCWFVNRLIGDMPRDAAIEMLRQLKLLRRDFGQKRLL